MKNKSLFPCIVGALAIAGCTVTGAPINSAQATQGREASYIAAQLAPDAALYTTQTFDWQDATRNRAVPVRLYLPTTISANRPVPLVVFSHGLGGSREGYKYLGRYFAANGYASLHLQHVGSDRQVWFGNPLGLVGRLSGAAQEGEAIDRARDVSFALDQLLAGEIGARIDREHIVAAGHSYGANTAMLVAGAQVPREGGVLSLRDPRIKAAILLSAPPFYGSEDTARILRDIDIPTLHITATADDIQIPGYNSGVIDRIEVYQAMGNGHGAPKALAVFKGGSHSIFTDRFGTGGVELNPLVKLATRDLALAFLNSLFAGDRESLARWPQKNASLLDRFEQTPTLLPK
jgi:dienelactone hydrolase